MTDKIAMLEAECGIAPGENWTIEWNALTMVVEGIHCQWQWQVRIGSEQLACGTVWTDKGEAMVEAVARAALAAMIETAP